MQFDCSFAENAFIQRGNLVHQRVDSIKSYAAKNVIHKNSVKLYHDDLGIYGVADCLEFRADKNGVPIPSLTGTFSLSVVEYKVTAPKKDLERTEDKMQVLAQKRCVDSLFSCESTCYFYYGDTKKRHLVEFQPEDQQFFLDTLEAIRRYKKEQRIPPKNPQQKCSGCSMKMLCLPKKK